MSAIYLVANSLISLYLLLLFIRILLSWFGGIESMGKAGEILGAITDPYLNLFRRLGFLRIGYFDFSPVVAIMVLSLISSVLTRLQAQLQVRIGMLLASILMMITSVISFFALILCILAVIRIISVFANLGRGSHFINMLDRIFHPLCFRLSRILFPRRIQTYSTNLILLAIFLALLYFSVDRAGLFLAEKLYQMPL